MKAINTTRRAAGAPRLSALLLGSCLLLFLALAQACSGEESTMTDSIRQQASTESGIGDSGTRMASSSVSASSSASASAAAGTNSGGCAAESSASADAGIDGERDYEHDSDRQVSRDGNCEARSESSANATTGESQSGDTAEPPENKTGGQKP